MHEFALAEAVIDTALGFAEKEGLTKISGVLVRIGELQNIEREIFDYALKEIMPQTEPRLASTVITLETEPARFCCRACEREFGLAETVGPQNEDEAEAMHFIPELAHTFLQCPACESPDFEMIAGRGVSIVSIEGE